MEDDDDDDEASLFLFPFLINAKILYSHFFEYTNVEIFLQRRKKKCTYIYVRAFDSDGILYYYFFIYYFFFPLSTHRDDGCCNIRNIMIINNRVLNMIYTRAVYIIIIITYLLLRVGSAPSERSPPPVSIEPREKQTHRSENDRRRDEWKNSISLLPFSPSARVPAGIYIFF